MGIFDDLKKKTGAPDLGDMEKYAMRPGETVEEYFKRVGAGDEQIGELMKTAAAMNASSASNDETDEYISDGTDRELIEAIKDMAKGVIGTIEDDDVYAMQLICELGADEELSAYISFAYNTESYFKKSGSSDRWNICCWKDDGMDGLDSGFVAAWAKAKGFDEYDDEGLMKAVYADAIKAVQELHEEHVTEEHFGRKVPILIGETELGDTTAIWSVKANGKDIIEKSLLEDCGVGGVYETESFEGSDRELIEAIKDMAKGVIGTIEDDDVYAMQLICELGACEGMTAYISFAYNTESYFKESGSRERWNICCWKDEEADGLDAEFVTAWAKAKGIGRRDDAGLMKAVYADAITAVQELHEEHVTEEHFGRKVPILIGEMEYGVMTAKASVRANGKDIIEKSLLEDCGVK